MAVVCSPFHSTSHTNISLYVLTLKKNYFSFTHISTVARRMKKNARMYEKNTQFVSFRKFGKNEVAHSLKKIANVGDRSAYFELQFLTHSLL